MEKIIDITKHTGYLQGPQAEIFDITNLSDRDKVILDMHYKKEKFEKDHPLLIPFLEKIQYIKLTCSVPDCGEKYPLALEIYIGTLGLCREHYIEKREKDKRKERIKRTIRKPNHINIELITKKTPEEGEIFNLLKRTRYTLDKTNPENPLPAT